MAATAALVVIKDFLYRGVREEYSNRWHLEGDSLPTSYATFTSFVDTWVVAEKPTVPSTTRFLRALWYPAGDDDALYSYDISVGGTVTFPPGTLSVGTGVKTPGDVAAIIKHMTVKRARGKPVYLMHYIHDVLADSGGGDALFAAQRTAMNTFATKLYNGTLSGTAKLCAPDGSDVSSGGANQYLTTRTLKRRGKRPPTS